MAGALVPSFFVPLVCSGVRMNRFQVMANYIRASELLVSVAPAGSGRDVWIDHALDVAVRVFPYAATCNDADARDLMEAAILHDTLEDTDLTPERLETVVGPEVRALVEIVTDPKGFTRTAQQRSLIARLNAAIQTHPDALLIKLADRISNVTECWVQRDSRLFMYRREVDRFNGAMTHLVNLAPAAWAGRPEAQRMIRQHYGLFYHRSSP